MVSVGFWSYGTRNIKKLLQSVSQPLIQLRTDRIVIYFLVSCPIWIHDLETCPQFQVSSPCHLYLPLSPLRHTADTGDIQCQWSLMPLQMTQYQWLRSFAEKMSFCCHLSACRQCNQNSAPWHWQNDIWRDIIFLSWNREEGYLFSSRTVKEGGKEILAHKLCISRSLKGILTFSEIFAQEKRSWIDKYCGFVLETPKFWLNTSLIYP